jgi:hypothetical protein
MRITSSLAAFMRGFYLKTGTGRLGATRLELSPSRRPTLFGLGTHAGMGSLGPAAGVPRTYSGHLFRMVRAAITTVDLSLTGVEIPITGVKLPLTGVRAVLTTVNLPLTGVKLAITGVKLLLTGADSRRPPPLPSTEILPRSGCR